MYLLILLPFKIIVYGVNDIEKSIFLLLEDHFVNGVKGIRHIGYANGLYSAGVENRPPS